MNYRRSSPANVTSHLLRNLWPLVIAAITLIGIIAVIQIVFWTAFFSSSKHTATSTIARSMALEHAEPSSSGWNYALLDQGLWLFWKAVSRD